MFPGRASVSKRATGLKRFCPGTKWGPNCSSLDVEVQVFLRLEQIPHLDGIIPKEEDQTPVCAEG